MQIYITRGGQQLGPFETEAVKGKLRDGSLSPADLGWHEGAAGWAPLSTFPGLVEVAAAPPPPPPPAAFPPPPPLPPMAGVGAGFYPPPVAAAAAGGSKPWLLWAIIGGALSLALIGGAVVLLMRKPAPSNWTPPSSSSSPSSTSSPSPSSSSFSSSSPSTGPSRGSAPAAAGTLRFVNSREGLDGKRASNYADFAFDYPAAWKLRKGREAQYDSNFVEVGNEIIDGKGRKNVIETFNVGYLQTSGVGTAADLLALAPSLLGQLEPQIAAGFPNYKKLSQGKTRIGPYEAYELRAQARLSGDAAGNASGADVWLRIVLVAPPARGQNGVSLFMISTSLADGMRGIDDVGAKGGTGTITNSFRFGK